MEISDGIVEWVTLIDEDPIPSTTIPEPIIPGYRNQIYHKQNELGDEEREDDE